MIDIPSRLAYAAKESFFNEAAKLNSSALDIVAALAILQAALIQSACSSNLNDCFTLAGVSDKITREKLLEFFKQHSPAG